MILTSLILALAGPLTLDDALARARSHPRAKAAVATVEQQRHRIDVARAGYYPTMNAQLGYSRATGNYTPQPGLNLRGAVVEPSNVNFPFYSAALNVQQTVWDFGRTRSNVEAAEAGAKAAEGDVEANLADLSLSVRVAFFGALGAEALEKASKDALANHERHLAQAQGLVELGRKPPYDVARVRVDVANAKLAVMQAFNAVKSARIDLGTAIGEALGEASLAGAEDDAKGLPATLEEALAAAAGRVELVRQDARIAAQKAQWEAARAAYWPTIGITGQVNERGASLPPVYNWQIGANMTVPILAGGADEARIEEQASAVEALERAREAIVLDLRTELEKAFVAIAEAGARLEATAEVVRQAKEALRLAEGRYEAGAGTVVELADAEASISNARAQEIRARFDLNVARSRLRRAIGTK